MIQKIENGSYFFLQTKTEGKSNKKLLVFSFEGKTDKSLETQLNTYERTKEERVREQLAFRLRTWGWHAWCNKIPMKK